VNMMADAVLEMSMDEGILRLLGAQSSGNEAQIALTDVRARAASELSRYGEKLVADLAMIGVTVPPAIQLQSTDETHVVVIGEHAKASAIADLINGDTCLLKWFKEVELLYTVIRRVETRMTGEDFAHQHFNLGVTSVGCIVFFTTT